MTVNNRKRIEVGARFLVVVVTTLSALLSSCAASPPQAEPGHVRREFIAARDALRHRDDAKFKALASGLQAYPLATYLQFDGLVRDLKTVQPNAASEFLVSTPSAVLRDRMRTIWTRELARRERWQDLVETYRGSDDLAVRCVFFTARLNLNQTAGLWEDIRSAWLSGKAAPRECDDAYAQFEKDARTSAELLWQKARLALENNNLDVASKLMPRLDSEAQKHVQLWAEVIRQPETIAERTRLQADSPITTAICVHAIRLLAKHDFRRAQREWDTLKQRFAFAPEQAAEVDKILGLAAAQELAVEAKSMLDRLPGSSSDAALQNARLRVGIATHDWEMLARWLDELPAPGVENRRWVYWRARVAELRGDQKMSQVEYCKLAAALDYYGRLSAERCNTETASAAVLSPVEPNRIAAFANQPAVVRAKELYFTGFTNEARAEWTSAIRELKEADLIAAATLAADWGWSDRSIATLAKVPQQRNAQLLFPQPFREQVMQNADRAKVDLALIYGVMRTESVFMEDAQSRAGALGLMQLMPETARETAAQLGMSLTTPQQLLLAQNNIPLGTSYLSRILERFQGNAVLAVAAYNAGPTRVESWRPVERCEQAEYWIETIPYSETRGYVRNVLFATSMYIRSKVDVAKPLIKLLAQSIAPRSSTGVPSNCELTTPNSI